jgi:hypothetical protein
MIKELSTIFTRTLYPGDILIEIFSSFGLINLRELYIFIQTLHIE